MIRLLFRRFGKNERGASLVEFAVAIPVLLLLVFGIIEFAWILNGHITLTGAVREGVRLAVISDHSDKSRSVIESEVKQVVMDHAMTFQLLEGDIDVLFGTYKKETVVEIKDPELPLLIGIFGNTYKMKSTKATMMHE